MNFKMNSKTQNILGVVMAVGAGIMAVINTLGEQRRDQDIENLKQDIAELKENKGDS